MITTLLLAAVVWFVGIGGLTALLEWCSKSSLPNFITEPLVLFALLGMVISGFAGLLLCLKAFIGG